VEIDKSYRVEKFDDWELQNIKEKSIIHSIVTDWRLSVLLLVIVIVVASVIGPILPPKYAGSWKPPTTTDEYLHRMQLILIGLPCVLLLAIIVNGIRTYIDLKSSVKRVANFHVTDVINLGFVKILIMNGWRLFSIRAKDDYFTSVQIGQIMVLKRTATYRLINYYLTDMKS